MKLSNACLLCACVCYLLGTRANADSCPATKVSKCHDTALDTCDTSYATIATGVAGRCGIWGGSCLTVDVCTAAAGGKTPDSAGASCVAMAKSGATESGAYYIKPAGAATAIQVYCDMENRNNDGAGWTLVFGLTGAKHSDAQRQRWEYAGQDLLDPATAEGPTKHLENTVKNAKYMKWTDMDYTPFNLLEFKYVGAFYDAITGTVPTQAEIPSNQRRFFSVWAYVLARWIKGPQRADDPQAPNPKYEITDSDGVKWVKMRMGKNMNCDNGDNVCNGDNSDDRPYYSAQNLCQGYGNYDYNSKDGRRGGSMDYLIWIKEE